MNYLPTATRFSGKRDLYVVFLPFLFKERGEIHEITPTKAVNC